MKAKQTTITDSGSPAFWDAWRVAGGAKAVTDRHGNVIAKCRVKWSRQGGCTALVYVSGRDGWVTGKGRATGYGYCKESAAMSEALHDAGFTFSERFRGRGENASDDALMAAAKAGTGKRKVKLINI